jgi:hypothetical protein
MTVAEKDKVFVREDDEGSAVVATGRHDRI